MDPHQTPSPPPVSFFLKRGTLLGAALGMLVGLIDLSVQGVEPEMEATSIVIWRNTILIGAAFGFFLGGGVGVWIRSRKETTNAETEPKRRVSQSSS